MNIHIQRELKKWNEAFWIGFALLEVPVLLFLAGYLFYSFPIIGVVLVLSVIIHAIGKKLIKNGFIDRFFQSRPVSKDAFVGGEEIKNG